MNILTLISLASLLVIPVFPIANRRLCSQRWTRIATSLLGFQIVIALVSGAIWLIGGEQAAAMLNPVPLGGFVHLDGFAMIMLAMVGILGLATARYSERFLDGEPGRVRFLKWHAFTFGAVSLTVATGDLVVLLGALILASFGLHPLLSYYQSRPAALRAANTKFLFSRLADVFLISAAAVIYREYGTTNLADLAGMMESDVRWGTTNTFIAAFLAIGAAIKSAQFPFHVWLPETMEAPTPVSSVMHAGIVNAGAIILIRTAPVIIPAREVMLALVALGSLTAILGALSMAAQSSVKRKLAYSTIAQMGFMMLQCGLGAFAAATLHIVAHSLYKAYAFLNSGDLESLQFKRSTAGGISANFAGLTLLSGVACFGIAYFTTTAPAILLLGFILTLGLMRWLAAIELGISARLVAGTVSTVLLVGAYLISYYAIENILRLAPQVEVAASLTSPWICAVVGLLFLSVFLLESTWTQWAAHPLIRSLRIHAVNGFYVDTAWRRIVKIATS